MTYMPRSALSASPAGGGTDLAAELSVNRRIRNAESFSESQALFTARTKRQVAVEADIARLRELAESLGVTDIDALEPSRIDETIADLAASGVDSQVVGQMRDLAASVSEQQAEILDLTRRLNTGNGEQFVILEGYRITDDFRGEAIDQRPVDSPVHALALSPAGNQLVVVEYQGQPPPLTDGRRDRHSSPAGCRGGWRTSRPTTSWSTWPPMSASRGSSGRIPSCGGLSRRGGRSCRRMSSTPPSPG